MIQAIQNIWGLMGLLRGIKTSIAQELANPLNPICFEWPES